MEHRDRRWQIPPPFAEVIWRKVRTAAPGRFLVLPMIRDHDALAERLFVAGSDE